MDSRAYYILYDVTSDISFIPVDGKSEYGDMAHAKKRADAIYKKKVTWRKVLGNVTFGYIDDEVTFAIAKKVKPQKLLRKKATSSKKKTTRRKNPKKLTYLIFNWNDYQLAFLHATNQWVSRRVAIRFTTKTQAAKIARSAAKQSRDLIGVAPSSMSSAQIIKAVKDGCISAMRKKKSTGKA